VVDIVASWGAASSAPTKYCRHCGAGRQSGDWRSQVASIPRRACCRF